MELEKRTSAANRIEKKKGKEKKDVSSGKPEAPIDPAEITQRAPPAPENEIE